MPAIALYGSGEFLPWAERVDRWCVENATAATDRVLVAPLASAPEGEDVFAHWARMGIEHYERMGLAPEVLEVRTREDAQDAAIARSIEGARLIFFSGGNPGHVAKTLQDTVVWQAILDALEHGASFGGCSAGAAAIGPLAPDVAGDEIEAWVPGLALLPRAYVMPHFDQLDNYGEGLRDLVIGMCPPGATLVGIDEETALMGNGADWSVAGARSVWLRDWDAESGVELRDGERIAVRLDG